MGVDAGIERQARGRRRYVRNPETVERLNRACPLCLAEPTRWCKGGYGRRFEPRLGFLHEER